jgi:hypothetical protein
LNTSKEKPFIASNPGVRDRIAISPSFALATYVFLILAAIATSFAFTIDPVLVVFFGALICGWSEVDGYCGASHVAAITPYRAMGEGSNLWVRAISAYTACGTVTALATGAILGCLGILVVTPFAHYFHVPVVLLSSLLLARELGWLSFSLPQVRLQTNKMWANEFGMVSGAAMWGAHIGFGVATVVKHGGFFLVICLILLLGPGQGSLLMATYWLGRTLPLWIAPVFVDPRSKSIVQDVLRNEDPFRHAAIVGMLLILLFVIGNMRNG